MSETTLTKGVEQLNSLLRGEISAVETYEQAIRRVGDEHSSEAAQLRAIAHVDGSARQLIADLLIPAQQRHITTLDAMMQRLDR